jgi:hypothetical protein
MTANSANNNCFQRRFTATTVGLRMVEPRFPCAQWSATFLIQNKLSVVLVTVAIS